MRFIFCSMMFADVENDIRKSRSPNTVSGHVFQENLVRGFSENNCDFSVINIPRIRRFPDYPAMLFHRQAVRWNDQTDMVHVGFLNLFGLNLLTQWRAVYQELKKQVKAANGEPVVILTFNSYIQTSLAMLSIRKKYPNVRLCTIVGDLHDSLGVANAQTGLKGKLIAKIERLQDRLAKKYDYFVFLTKYMASALGVEDRPHTVMEGLYQVKEPDCELSSVCAEKTVFYAGSLCEEYGIAHLLRAFSMIEDPQFRLWIAGKNGQVDLVRQYAQEDPRITYLGFITPAEVSRYQQEATVLINPRTSELEFVKYSFASKTLECLASGKPYIAHRLPCDPPEYGQYIQYADGETDQALRDKIMEICALSKSDRDELGQKAKQFIISEKNPKTMCQKILDMFHNAFCNPNQ